jgi:translation initiation factor 2B subunit (eIF-2B alpha/beta/delta family)
MVPAAPTFAHDSVSPQSELVDDAVAWLASRVGALDEAGDAGGSGTGVGWSDGLARACVDLADAQPAMAAFIALGTRALAVARKADDESAPLPEKSGRVREAIEAWRRDWHVATESLVSEAQAALPDSGWVATTTRSSLVERALLAAHASGRAVRVLCGESRPMNEGRLLAAALARAGAPVWLVVDGALPLLLPQAGALWIGVDAVREKTLVTKTGTHALLLVARELSLPCYALAQRAKFLPDRCHRLTLPRRDASEVWPEAPPGVQIVNPPFEEVPLSLLRGVVTESGFLGPRETADAAGVAMVAKELMEPAAASATTR